MAKPARLLNPQPVEVSIVKTCALHTFRLARRLAVASEAAPGYTRIVVREIAEAWRGATETRRGQQSELARWFAHRRCRT